MLLSTRNTCYNRRCTTRRKKKATIGRVVAQIIPAMTYKTNQHTRNIHALLRLQVFHSQAAGAIAVNNDATHAHVDT